MPVYNVEQYIRDSLDSIVNQTFSDFELILVDDGSTDASGRICDEYAAKDQRIQVVHNTNHGLIFTRRLAFSKARGEYCVIVDSDDRIRTDALSVLYQTIQTYQSDCIIYGYERIYQGRVIHRSVNPKLEHVTNKRDIFMKVFLNTDYNAIWRKAFKRSLLDGRDYSEFYHLSLGEDLLQSLEVLENAKNATFIPEALYQYTLNPKSMTQEVIAKNYKIDVSIRLKALKFLESSGELSEEDLVRYKTGCLKTLYTEIVRIGKFDCENSIKKKYMEELLDESYYQDLLKTKGSEKYLGAKQKVLLYLFKHRHFGTIMRICNMLG